MKGSERSLTCQQDHIGRYVIIESRCKSSLGFQPSFPHLRILKKYNTLGDGSHKNTMQQMPGDIDVKSEIRSWCLSYIYRSPACLFYVIACLVEQVLPSPTLKFLQHDISERCGSPMRTPTLLTTFGPLKMLLIRNGVPISIGSNADIGSIYRRIPKQPSATSQHAPVPLATSPAGTTVAAVATSSATTTRPMLCLWTRMQAFTLVARELEPAITALLSIANGRLPEAVAATAIAQQIQPITLEHLLHQA